MSGFDTTLVAYHVRRLDADGLAALVADLWRARGYETAREGTDVLASHGTETVRIRVTAGSRGTSASPDVVVSGDGSDCEGTRVVDPATVAELLGYAVDRPTARDICRRHLGAPPGDLLPPPAMRFRQRVGALGTATPVLALGLGVLAVVLVVGLLGATSIPGAGGLAGAVTGSDTGPETVPAGPIQEEPVTGTDDGRPPKAAGASVGASRPGTADRGPPPGVTLAGIEDIDALAAAHASAVANRSHTVWIDWYRPRYLRPDGTRVQRDIDIASDGDRYLIHTSNEIGGNRTRSGAIYHDGSGIYVAVWNETAKRYGRVFRITPRQNTVPTPESVRTGLVTQYLSTPRTNVTGTVRRDGRTLYRIVGEGRPNTSSAITIHNYTVEALVDSRGFVRDVTVRATVAHPDVESRESFRIKREITYGRVGSTTVATPDWYLNHTAGG